MKLICSALFVLALAASSMAMNSSWGSRNASDYLLALDNVVRVAQYNAYQSLTVDFPKAGQSNTKTITAIFVYDRFTNSSGATASLWSGGPGYRFASINLKSQYGKGVNSTIEIYGK